MVLSMKRWKGKVAVVTGASSGIGAAIASKLTEEGLKVVGLARRKENIEKLSQELSSKEEKLHALKTDLSKEEDIVKAFDWIKSNLGPVHILVNNAGYLAPTNLLKGESALWRNVIDVNLMAVAITTREALNSMMDNNIDGHVIHINSISGQYHVNLPNLNIYPATKYGVTAMANTLRSELTGINSKIRITNISPGLVRTPMVIQNNDLHLPEDNPFLEPEDVADSVVYALSTPARVQIHEIMIKPVGEKI